MYLNVFNQRFTDRMLKILEGQGQGQQFQTLRKLAHDQETVQE